MPRFTDSFRNDARAAHTGTDPYRGRAHGRERLDTGALRSVL
ncbi:hypothetical protein [Nocardia uniformis]|nr:hypothetical protein [Nocardia uniformis]